MSILNHTERELAATRASAAPGPYAPLVHNHDDRYLVSENWNGGTPVDLSGGPILVPVS